MFKILFFFNILFLDNCLHAALLNAKLIDEKQYSVREKLIDIINKKQTPLAFAADVTTKKKLLDLANEVGPEICILKTHIDMIKDFDNDLIVQLKQLAKKHDFLILEDRKFADIGLTMQLQYTEGMYNIVNWADIVTVHTITGEESINALKLAAQQATQKPRGALLIAQLSCKGNLIDNLYTKSSIEIAKKHKDFVIGFIAQELNDKDAQLLVCTPGIHMDSTGDQLGQRYNTPQSALNRDTDIIIVGRAIYDAPNPCKAAQLYRKQAWNAKTTKKRLNAKL